MDENQPGILSRDTSVAYLTFDGKIMSITIKDGVIINEETIREMFVARRAMVGEDLYGVLIDGHNVFKASKEARKLMGHYTRPNRVATAIVASNPAMRLIGNFFVKVNKPKTPAMLFSNREDAKAWLLGLLAAREEGE